MSQIGPLIAASANQCVAYAEKLCGDITPQDFACLPTAGEKIIESNHPAFILGHLSLYPSRVVAELGGDAGPIEPGEAENTLFGPGNSCVDDPHLQKYPKADELIGRFNDRHQAAIRKLLETDDQVFAAPNANEKMRPRFPTIGAMHAFYMGGHLMMHLGQLSTWRRIMGYGSA